MAIASLRDIYDFYRPKTGRQKAKEIVNDLRNETRYLLIFPEMGAKEIQVSASYRYIVRNHCKIYYTIFPNYILIAFVWDTRRNPEQLAKYVQ